MRRCDDTFVICQLVCVINSWAHTSLVHSILSLKLGVTSKVQEVMNWKAPTLVHKVWSFLGLAGYYRRFLPDFSKIAKPMTRLLQKDEKFVWTLECTGLGCVLMQEGQVIAYASHQL